MSSHAVSHQHCSDSTDVFGFWLYIMTDCVLFGSLFAAFLVLHQPGSYGPSLKSHIDLHYVLHETLFLLCSNFAFGLAIMASYKGWIKRTQALLLLTWVWASLPWS